MHGTQRRHVGYHAMRLRWCRLALQQWLRRWGVYALVTVAVVGAGTNAPVAVVAGLAGALVAPLCRAAALGAWLLPATVLQALLGAGCVWGARALLWPAHWGESERALPLQRGLLLRSDAWLVAAALVPLAALYLAGAVSLFSANPPWLQPVRGRAVAALLLATLGSLGLGVLLLQHLRRAPAAGRAAGHAATRSAGGAASAPAVPAVAAAPAAAGGFGQPPRSRHAWLLALLVLPLWRGPARRSGQVMALGGLALLLPAAAASRWPAWAAWALALQSALGLVVTTRANTLSRLELAPLLQACLPLPMYRPLLERARALLCLLPWAVAAAAMTLSLPAAAPRGAVLAAWLAACAASAVFEVLAAPAEAADKAARWLFCLAVCIALATEVLR